jgi:hypothetical protein
MRLIRRGRRWSFRSNFVSFKLAHRVPMVNEEVKNLRITSKVYLTLD